MLNPSLTKVFVDEWTCSLPGTRASHFPQPGQDEVQTTHGTCGRTLQGEFSFADPAGSSLKTSRDTLRWDSPQSLVTWKKWVTDRRGEYSQRLKSAHHTNGNGSSSWLTPVTPAPHDSENSVGNPNIKRRQKELCHQVAMWPTASARDYKDTPGMSKERDGKELGRIDQLPRAVYYYNGLPDREKLNKSGKNHEQWQTPEAKNITGYHKQKNGTVISKLGNQVAQWPTTSAGSSNGGQGLGLSGGSGNRKKLAALGAEGREMMDPKKLNPNWVEQLMGLTVGWTQLPTDWTD
jgi:hypothetical protein